MTGLPILLKAFTTCVPGILDCISFNNELLGVVKNCSTPFTGGHPQWNW